ncbi:MAG: long-chain-fatty-acid--CoA ligase [Elusimicrobiota bacterium]|jgi:long-chain acyl-CoA synthetase|nr:long-chain-fatty-acid--CoA ligase [Elusimicrobiota bacterium]
MEIRKTDIYTSLADSAYRRPESPAAVAAGKTWTFHELLMKVDRAADMFWQLGVRKNDKVAVALKNSIEVIVTNYALYKIGAVCVPINFMISKAAELKFILGDCKVKIVVTQAEYLRSYAAVKEDLPDLKYILSTDDIPSNCKENSSIKLFWPLLEESKFNNEMLSLKTTPNDIAMLLYTSGTTGNPKGVILTHNNIISNAHSCVLSFKITEEDAFLCILPMFHTFAWTTSIVLPLALGIKVVLVANITPASSWLHLMGREKVTIMVAVPQLFGVLAKEAKGFKRLYLQYWAFRKVRFCVSGAAPLNREVQRHFEEQLDVPLLEGYGLTETSPVLSVNTEHNKKAGSVGINLPYVKIKILDDEGNEMPRNAEGEICAKGENVTQGYFNNPAATSEVFDKNGWLRTGDIGIIDDEGFIFIRDRKKDMIIIKGLKVFSAQVEAVINEYPAIEECAVVGVPDGRGDEFIKLYAAKKKGVDLDEADFRKFLKTKLDNYKRPRDVEFLEELPKNSLRKILKKDLRKDAVEKYKARSASAAVPASAEL